MSASKIFGALLWSIGAAIIVIYSSWVALQLVSILWQDSMLHPLMELNLTMMKLRLRTRVTENDDLNIIANHTETTPLNFSIFHREQKLTRLFFDL